MTEPAAQGNSKTMALIVYVLYLASLVLGITSIIGLIMAYVYRGEGPAWLDTHFQYQIRTFWIGLLYTFISGVLIWVWIGWLLLLAVVVWWIVRAVIGLLALDKGVPVNNPASWLF